MLMVVAEGGGLVVSGVCVREMRYEVEGAYPLPSPFISITVFKDDVSIDTKLLYLVTAPTFCGLLYFMLLPLKILREDFYGKSVSKSDLSHIDGEVVCA